MLFFVDQPKCRFDVTLPAKSLAALLIAIFLSSCGGSAGNDNGGFPASGTVSVPEGSGTEWVLVFEDNFDGINPDRTGLDTSIWETLSGTGLQHGLTGWGNNELQFYRGEGDNIEVRDGKLIITAQRHPSGLDLTEQDVDGNDVTNSFDYTSARLRTEGRLDITYGRIEASIKLPDDAGLWPAFWTLGSEPSAYGVWPARGEIDIMEHFGRSSPNSIGGAVHYGMEVPQNEVSSATFNFPAVASNIEPESTACVAFVEDTDGNKTCTLVDNAVNPDGLDCLSFDSAGSCTETLDRCLLTTPCPRGDPTDGFHTYAIEWDAEQIRWFVDGLHYFTVRAETYWAYGYQSLQQGFFGAGRPSAPFDVAQHLLLNMAVGGNPLNGEVPDGSFMSADMEVEYVRVYQCPINAATGVGCRNSIDNINIFREFEVPANEASPVTASLDLYSAGPLVLFESPNDKILQLLIDDASSDLTIQEAGSIDGSRTNVLRIQDFGGDAGVSGSVALVDSGAGDFRINGIGTSDNSGSFGGEILFDIYIDSANTDLASPLEIGMGSPGARRFYPLALGRGDLPKDEWTRISIKISDIIAVRQGDADQTMVDILATTELIVVQPTGLANVDIDNITFRCGSPTACGIVSAASLPLQVFGTAPDLAAEAFVADSIGALWNRGLAAFDNVNGDYQVPTGNHVEWQITDLDPDPFVEENVIDVFFRDQATSGVIFIGAFTPRDLSSYFAGELVFDITVLSNPTDEPFFFKVDHDPNEFEQPGSGTGEQPILPQPVVGVPQTVRVPVCGLELLGLRATEIISPLVIVPGVGGSAQNVSFRLDNIYFNDTSVAGCDVALPTIDFDDENTIYAFSNFASGVTDVIDNPQSGGINTSNRVARMVKYPNPTELFGGSFLSLSEPVDFTNGSELTLKTFATRTGMNVLVKLESSTSSLEASRTFTTSIANDWEQIALDFTGSEVEGLDVLTVIIDNGIEGDGTDDFTLLFDDIQQQASSLTPAELPYDFDNPNLAYPLTESVDNHTTAIVSDPELGGTRGNVAEITFPAGPKQPFAFTSLGSSLGFSNSLPIVGTDVEIAIDVFVPSSSLSVRFPAPGQSATEIPVLLKIEDGANSLTSSADIIINTTAVDTWQTLTYSIDSLAPGDDFEKVVIFFDPGQVTLSLADVKFYWDNVRIVTP